MANEKNLIPFDKRTESEQREIAKKGGKKSGEARRNKKLLKDCMINLLSLPVNNQKDWNKLSRFGIEPDDIDNKELLTVALFKRALSGDVSAYKEIRSVIGEDRESNEEQMQKLDEVLDKIGGNI